MLVGDEGREAQPGQPPGSASEGSSGPTLSAPSESADAARQYNSALTRLDHACQSAPAWPPAPPPLDGSQLGRVNDNWRILPSDQPPRGAGMRGRLAGFVWRLIAPALQQQQSFNAALVDHLNRNTQGQAEGQQALAVLVLRLREAFDGLVRFESLLLQFLQQIDDLRLDGNIQGRHRFVAHDEFRTHRQGTGDANALALTAAEFVRVTIIMVLAQANLLE